MELLALVLINIFFGIILYFVISIKVSNSLKDYQINKMKKEIQNHTLNFYKESENYLALMDSKISILKNLIQKAESMGFKIDSNGEIINTATTSPNKRKKSNKNQIDSRTISEAVESSNIQISKNNKSKKEISNPAQQINNPSQENSKEELSLVSDFISGIGKGFKSVFGINSEESKPVVEDTPVISKKIAIKRKSIDVSVGGDPFEDIKEVIDNTVKPDKNNFKNILENVNKPNPYKSYNDDQIKISIQAAISELSKESSKIDKVVFLLKRGYSHEEISEALGLAIPEISLIETIKLEKNRRI